MTNTIKAIQTRYAGCHFRSRLEARWAVYFDTLGWQWEYEPQGYVLPSGPYLPDFWLPDRHIFWEIKGEKPTAVEVQRAVELSVATDRNVLIIHGSIPAPNHRGSYVICGPYMDEPIYSNGMHLDPHGVTAARSARFEHGQSGASEPAAIGPPPIRKSATPLRITYGPAPLSPLSTDEIRARHLQRGTDRDPR